MAHDRRTHALCIKVLVHVGRAMAHVREHSPGTRLVFVDAPLKRRGLWRVRGLLRVEERGLPRRMGLRRDRSEDGACGAPGGAADADAAVVAVIGRGAGLLFSVEEGGFERIGICDGDSS